MTNGEIPDEMTNDEIPNEITNDEIRYVSTGLRHLPIEFSVALVW